MSNEQNKQVVRRLFHVFEDGNTAEISQIIAPNWENHDPSVPPMRGVDGARQLTNLFHTAYPDGIVTIGREVTEGDRVGVYFTLTGTHLGQFFDIPPTGKRVNVSGAGIFRVVDGKITDNWVNFDAMGVMQQLGVIPPQGQAQR